MSNILLPREKTAAGLTIVRLPYEYMRMLAVFAKTNREPNVNLELYCPECRTFMRGQNASDDNNWSMDCGCRLFIGVNPIQGH